MPILEEDRVLASALAEAKKKRIKILTVVKAFCAKKNKSPDDIVPAFEKLSEYLENILDDNLECGIALNRIDIHEFADPSVAKEAKEVFTILSKANIVDEYRKRDGGMDWLRDIAEKVEIDLYWDWQYQLERYLKLIPPYVKTGTRVPKKLRDTHRESRWCFVYGQFMGTIALSRVVVETAVKEKYNFSQKDSKYTAGTLLDKAFQFKWINEKTAKLGWTITKRADLVMHRAHKPTEKAALTIIENTMLFLKQLYSKRQ